MLQDNQTLLQAQQDKFGEVFMMIEEIRKELHNYKSNLKGKKVYSPNTKTTLQFAQCDAFARFFSSSSIMREFELKEFSYSYYNENGDFVLFTFSANGGMSKTIISASLDDSRLFNVCKQIDNVDVVVCNPEGSKLNELFRYIFLAGKSYILSVHKLFISNKIGFFALRNGNLKFGCNLPKMYYNLKKNKVESRGDMMWITNFDNGHNPNFISTFYLTDSYEYQMLDNYNALSVDCIKMIPMDYNGVMCVPATIIPSINLEQFEIIGCLSSSGYDQNVTGLPKLYNDVDSRAVVNGKVLHARILIRFRNI